MSDSLLNLAGAVVIVVAGLAVIYRRQLGRLGQVSAWSYAYAYVFFTGTVIFALIVHVVDWGALTARFGAWMTVHSVLMVVAGSPWFCLVGTVAYAAAFLVSLSRSSYFVVREDWMVRRRRQLGTAGLTVAVLVAIAGVVGG